MIGDLPERNASLPFDATNWIGQTFIATHTGNYIYLQFDLLVYARRYPPYLEIYLTDAEHHPTGAPIYRTSYRLSAWEETGRMLRRGWHIFFTSFTAGTEYFIMFRDYSPAFVGDSKIGIRQGDGPYIPGSLWTTDDSGDTWLEHPDDDIVFGFIMTGETPPIPPVPPAYKFAILDLFQQLTGTGIRITVTTNVPCHLFCYWTDKEPEKHLIPILRRGLPIHTQLKYCFVNWHENEQEEPYDTMTHTFTKEPWAICETRWLTFRAKVSGQWVTSVGPIFKKHRFIPEYDPEEYALFYSLPGSWGFCCDGQTVGAPSPPDSFYAARSIGTAAYTASQGAGVGFTSYDEANTWRWNAHVFFHFDTRELPLGALITRARLRLENYNKSSEFPNCSFSVVKSLSSFAGQLYPSDHIKQGILPASEIKDLETQIPAYGTTLWEFNDYGYTLIIPAGITKLSVREMTYDAPNTPPTWLSEKSSRFGIRTTDHPTSSYHPRLEVWFKPIS